MGINDEMGVYLRAKIYEAVSYEIEKLSRERLAEIAREEVEKVLSRFIVVVGREHDGKKA